LTRRAPLPEGFGGDPFRVSDARGAGATSNRLRARDLSRPFWGIRSARPDVTIIDRCESLVPRLPIGACYSHSTAALLFGAPLPTQVEVASGLHVTVPRGQRAMDAAGVVGHQLTLSSGDVGTVAGLPVTTPARTWCDLAPMLRMDELVAVGDFFLRRDAPLTSRTAIREAFNRHVGRQGMRTRRDALALLDDRSESPTESRLRVLLVTAGIADLDVNVPLYAADGGFLARPDLRIRGTQVLLEYEGDHHRTDRNQWKRDIARVERLQANGWHVVRVTKDDLDSPEQFLRRLRRTLARLA
jgi:hypothetical protein